MEAVTPDPQPILSTLLPKPPAPKWEYCTWFPRPDGGGDLSPGQHGRGVVVRRRVSYGRWEPVTPGRFADDPTGTDDDYCGVEPPTRADDPRTNWGDCWCTLPANHEGECLCEPCHVRHGAPGWMRDA